MENKFRLVLKNINDNVITQGNLDPAILSCDNPLVIKEEVYRILDQHTKDVIYLMLSWINSEVKNKNVKYAIKLIDDYY